MTTNTEYHAKYFAHELSKLHSVADAGKLADTLVKSVGYYKVISSFCSTGMDVEIGEWTAQHHARYISYVSYLRVCADMFVVGDVG